MLTDRQRDYLEAGAILLEDTLEHAELGKALRAITERTRDTLVTISTAANVIAQHGYYYTSEDLMAIVRETDVVCKCCGAKPYVTGSDLVFCVTPTCACYATPIPRAMWYSVMVHAIKPLDWKYTKSTLYESYRADVPHGAYEVQCWQNNGWFWFFVSNDMILGMKHQCVSARQGMSAAEADLRKLVGEYLR